VTHTNVCIVLKSLGSSSRAFLEGTANSFIFSVVLFKLINVCVCREKILQMVEENPVVIVKGEPGCGKSTQVPQYIMEHWEALQRGVHCNIIVTQPRRLSAISLAEWVAYERQERVSDIMTKDLY
jgi:hypothetical protein